MSADAAATERHTPAWLPKHPHEQRPGGCPRCEGTGALGSDEDASPWSAWSTLRPPADLALRAGLVWPVICTTCAGTGLAPAPEVDDQQVDTLLGDVAQQVERMRAGWPTWNTATRRDAVNELNCRAGEADEALLAAIVWAEAHGERPGPGDEGPLDIDDDEDEDGS